MNSVEATQSYESWLHSQIEVLEQDLVNKHQLMSDHLFPYFRATYYRWIQRFNEICPELCTAPKLLAVGDLHVENFGTWRDAEGRLVWGINDFDEAYDAIPYTLDLVRLISSALIAIDGSGLTLWSEPKKACKAVISGYQEALRTGGAAFVLAERHAWLRRVSVERLKQPTRFWDRLDQIPDFEGEPPRGVRDVLTRALPRPDLQYRFIHRVAGLGSLGRPRFVAIADFDGGRVAREAKSLVPSAHIWAETSNRPAEAWPALIDKQAIRCNDPFWHIDQGWIVRRLAPDCSRIELSDLPKEHDELKLLNGMAFECGNVHLGSSAASVKTATADAAGEAAGAAGKPQSEIERHLSSLPKGWLLDASERMLDAVRKDWKDWRKYHKASQKSAAASATPATPAK